jgi:hypothetical protein
MRRVRPVVWHDRARNPPCGSLPPETLRMKRSQPDCYWLHRRLARSIMVLGQERLACALVPGLGPL